MTTYQHATLDRDKAEKIGETYAGWKASRGSE